MLRFVLLFAALVLAFELVAMTRLATERAWPAYLRWNAAAAAGLLRALGHPATADERVLRSPEASLLIERGCDAVQPSALFLAAVLASPVAFAAKLPGMLLGTAFLMALNLVRIASLFWVRVRWPAAFELLHVDVWQALFIFLAVLLWGAWAVWAVRRARAPTRRADA